MLSCCSRPTGPVLLACGMAAFLVGAARGSGRAGEKPAHPAGRSPAPEATGTPSASEPAVDATAASPADTAMLWKYVARCALKRGQSVEGPAGGRFEGALGMAPEWRDGICDVACQEKVSSCLFALTNPTGNHVQVSLLGNDPSLPHGMQPSDTDLPYAFQEGAFFGNVFTGEAFVCRGRDAAKGAAVKRWCAIDPRLCNVLAEFHDAGPCEQACEMSCSRLSDGSRRCLASRCRDPQGRVWARPITTFLRNRIEAGNADAMEGVLSRDQGLEQITDGARATFRAVDFGPAGRREHTFIAHLAAPRGGGRIEIWLGNERQLGTLAVAATGRHARDISARFITQDLSGPRELVLRFVGLEPKARIETIAIR
jgi:hypothetical protein